MSKLINLAVPSVFGGGYLSGNSLEEALGNFLSRFSQDDVRAFAAGYWDYHKRKEGAQPLQKVAMVRPSTTMATVSTSKPVKAATPSKPAPKPTRASLWQDILRHAGSNEPRAIAAFMETELGNKIYAQWLLAE